MEAPFYCQKEVCRSHLVLHVHGYADVVFVSQRLETPSFASPLSIHSTLPFRLSFSLSHPVLKLSFQRLVQILATAHAYTHPVSCTASRIPFVVHIQLHYAVSPEVSIDNLVDMVAFFYHTSTRFVRSLHRRHPIGPEELGNIALHRRTREERARSTSLRLMQTGWLFPVPCEAVSAKRTFEDGCGRLRRD